MTDSGLPTPPMGTGAMQSAASGPWGYFMDVMKNNFANFEGRARRAEYWWFVLVSWGILIGLGILAIIFLNVAEPLGYLMVFAAGAFWLAMLIPYFAVAVRRLHDTNKPTWMIVFAFLPLLSLVFLIFMFIDSDRGSNDFGPSPKYGA